MKEDVVKLEGVYKLEDWKKLSDFLKSINQSYTIDYSGAVVDIGIKMILDDFNSKIEYKFQEEEQVSFSTYLGSFFSGMMKYVEKFLDFVADLFGFGPKKFQREIWWQDVLNCAYNSGICAIPVVMLLSFSLGIVLSLQGCKQLKMFGAQVFTIDLVTLSFFKEMGLLISCIILAARSGSSIISRLGIMKISEEWDAIRVIGIRPEIFLLQPKVVALVAIAPLLGFVANFSGILGAYITLIYSLDVNTQFFINTIGNNLEFFTFFSTLWKGPIFGAVIALIACFEGSRVYGSSENVGFATTRGVVYSISAIILLDTFINFLFLDFL